MGTVRRAPVAAPALLQTSQTWKEKERSAPARPHANWKWRHRENLKNWRYVIGRTVIAEQGAAQSNGNRHVPEAYFALQFKKFHHSPRVNPKTARAIREVTAKICEMVPNP